MSDIDISTPNTAFGNLQDGSILLFQKNSDGTFSPLALNRSLAEIVQQILVEFSEETPLAVVREVKLKQLK